MTHIKYKTFYLWVANSWNPGDAFTTLPCAGTDSVRDSSNGINTEITSIGARSISSKRIQYPACTACSSGPACHTNSPGVSVHTYVPNKDLKRKTLPLERAETHATEKLIWLIYQITSEFYRVNSNLVCIWAIGLHPCSQDINFNCP